ncbi:MAG: hypothetical protein Q7W54_04175 [Bacteroidota bacterium]|nr:hypothetical protein [Bacteroidota bacterium]
MKKLKPTFARIKISKLTGLFPNLNGVIWELIYVFDRFVKVKINLDQKLLSF